MSFASALLGCSTSRGLRRFVYVSSSGVYGTTRDQDIAIDLDPRLRHARGIAAVVAAPRLKHDTYNLSSGGSQTIRSIIDVTLAYLGRADFRVTDDFAEVNINLISGKPRGPLAIDSIRQD